MRLSGYQPQYFPRLHYFARILDSDIFEISDYAQFVKKHAYSVAGSKSKRYKSYQADAPIKLQQGIHFLAVPVKHEGLLPINKTKIDYNNGWLEKHLRTIETAYSKAKNFKKIFPDINEILKISYKSIAELNITTILWAVAGILGHFELRPRDINLDLINNLLESQNFFRLKKVIILSKTDILPPHQNRDATDWIIDICKKCEAREYYFGGTSAAAYMDFNRFERAGIKTVQQEWKCPVYRQQYSKAGFIPNLSIIDLLFNAEREETIRVLRGD